jgi:nucleotide-binding universal stress UspA family protein
MKFRKILFATDFSDASAMALSVAACLARDCQAELVIVHVQQPPAANAGEEMIGSLYEIDDARARTQLEGLQLPITGLNVRRELLLGPAADEIVNFAQQEKVDLVVLGTHGRTGLSRLLMGSVAELTVRRAQCPVLTVKPHATALGS